MDIFYKAFEEGIRYLKENREVRVGEFLDHLIEFCSDEVPTVDREAVKNVFYALNYNRITRVTFVRENGFDYYNNKVRLREDDMEVSLDGIDFGKYESSFKVWAEK